MVPGLLRDARWWHRFFLLFLYISETLLAHIHSRGEKRDSSSTTGSFYRLWHDVAAPSGHVGICGGTVPGPHARRPFPYRPYTPLPLRARPHHRHPTHPPD